MEKNYEIWQDAKKDVNISGQQLEEINKLAMEDAFLDLEIVKKIGEVQDEIKCQEKYLSNNPDEGLLSDSTVSAILPIYAGSAAQTCTNLIDLKNFIKLNVEEKRKFVLYGPVYNTISGSSTGSYEFYEIVQRSKEVSNVLNIVEFEPIEKKSMSREETYSELLEKLHQFGSGFENRLIISERAIEEKYKGWKDHSVSNTVELIDKLLQRFAQIKLIKMEKWFIPDTSSKSGVTRSHRVKYFMLRNVKSEDPDILSDIDFWSPKLILAFNQLEALKHNFIDDFKEEEIIARIDYSRLVLLNIINYPSKLIYE